MEWTSLIRWNEIHLNANPRRKLPEPYQRCLVLWQVRGRVLLDVATYKASERVFSTPTQDISVENGMLWVPASCVRADRRNV